MRNFSQQIALRIFIDLSFFFISPSLLCASFAHILQTGLELKENLASGAPWAYPYPYPYDPSLGPYAFNG